jgi:plasmid stability protein
MPNLTIQNIDESLTMGLRLRAAKHGQSMKEEARQILRQVILHSSASSIGLGSRIHRRFASLGGVELSLPQRLPSRQPPDFLESKDT